jgi:4-amino-4-deoxy-L-arabinose transferase-like glycosyltransferase
MAGPDPVLPAARPTPAVLWLACAVSVLAALSPRDLWNPDETRYGRVAHEMAESGDWLVPRWNGAPYPEKPPLGFWAMAAAGKALGGVSPLAARLPCALLAALAVLATAALARRWFGDPALGDTAALLFATSGLVLWNGPRATLDLPMTAFSLLALLAGTRLVARPTLLAALACGAALGLGVLTKGPHALLVPLAALAGGAFAAGKPRRLLDPRWLVVLATAAAVVAAWLVPALVAGPEEYGRRLLGQLGSRLTGLDEPHDNPVWYLPPLLLAAGLPWTPAWVLGIAVAASRTRPPREDRFGLGACLFGAAVPLLLLSLPATKRDVYLLPLLPGLATLAAYALHRVGPGRRTGIALEAVAASLALVALAAFATPFLAPVLWPGDAHDVVAGPALATAPTAFALGAFGTLAAAAALAAHLRRGDPVAAARGAGVALLAASLVLALAVLPVFDPAKSWRSAAEAARAWPDRPVVMSRFRDAGLVWAMRPRVVEARDGTRAVLGPDAPEALVVFEDDAWRRLAARDPALAASATTVWLRRVGRTVQRMVRTRTGP